MKLTLAELKKECVTAKYLSKAAITDFDMYNHSYTYLYKGVSVCIEVEFYPNKWIYNSDDISLSGRFTGKLSSLVNLLKHRIEGRQA